MDIDLKIGAVFSLADEENGVSGNGSGDSGTKDQVEDSSEFLLPDRDDSFEIDIMSSPSWDQSTSTSTPKPISDHMSYTVVQDSKSYTTPTESTSIVEDPDAPPSLLLEKSSSQEFASPSLVSSLECMSPPILQPEEPVKIDVTVVKKKCTKIAPCYIVLTNIDQFMKAESSVSSRTFKRSFVECSNMCKKVMFKRNLKAGKDVFNVKTPSKQKDYLIYLLKIEKERSKRNRKKPYYSPQIRDIIEKHNLKLAARKNAVGKPAHPRVRRTVSRLPNDFATRPISPNTSEVGEAEENKRDLSTEELAKLQNEYVKRKQKVELNSLKRLITIKRSLNLNLKRSKRNRSEGYENFLKSDVTSSVSGRVRKVNPKYIGDFAVCRKDFDEKRLVAVAEAQFKRAESANKKRVEEINKSNDYLQRKRKTLTDSLSHTDKKLKTADVVIDNPEKDDISSFHVKQKKSQKNVSKSRNKSVSVKVPLICSQENVFITSERSKSLKQKKNQTDNRDGVLIQDMPREENVISGFLRNISCDDIGTDMSATSEAEDYMASGNKQGDQYVRAKQLLKDSLEKRISKTRQLKIRQISPIKREVQTSLFTNEHVGDQEKYKMLKIPESVQKLFTNKEIKQEPLDDGYEATSTCSPGVSDSKVVTVTYSNGIYKKVVVSLSSPGQAPSNQGPVTMKAGMTQGPILVNTNQGLRYLVPKSALAKQTLSNYNEGIKAKFVPVKPDLKSIALTASEPSVTTNNTIGILNMSSAIQTGNSALATQLITQTNPEQQRMQNVLSAFPSVVQVPLQTVINSSNANSLLRPAFATPTLKVGNTRVNKSLLPTVASANTPVSTSTLQTHTVVHKVSPVVLRQSTHNQTEQSNNTSILQQSVPLSNAIGSGIQVTSEAQNQKNTDKCKFYLLKIDGKNVLIPIEGDQAQPKAYVVNSDIISANTQSQNLVTDTFTPAANNTASPTRPAVITIPQSGGTTQPKPTLAVVPNMKQVNSILPTQFTFVPSTTMSSQSKSLLQTVTLTNIASAVGGAGNTALISGVNSTIASCSVSTSTKTAKTYTSVVKSGSYKLTTQPVSTQSSLSQNNIQTSSAMKIPVYLKLADSSPVPSSQKPTVITSSTKSAFSAVQTPVFVRPAIQKKNKTQPFGVLSDILKSQPYGKLPLPPLSAIKKVNEQKKMVVNENSEESVTKRSGGLCEKSGVFLPEKVSAVEEEKPQAFKEAVTAREERLRRLKELLKEKQKAVEDIRSNKSN